MTLNGKSDCKVCPAIKKWVDRKNNEENTSAKIMTVEDVRDEAMDAGREEEEENMREEAPVMDDEDPTPRVGNFSALKVSESTGSNTSSTYASTSDGTEDTDAIRARARQIIMSAKGSENWQDDADDSDDDSDNGTSIQSSYKSSIKFALSTDSSNSVDEEAFIRDRAAAIINQARKNCHTEQQLVEEEEQSDNEDEEAEVVTKSFPPPSISTPRAISPKKVSSFHYKHRFDAMTIFNFLIYLTFPSLTCILFINSLPALKLKRPTLAWDHGKPPSSSSLLPGHTLPRKWYTGCYLESMRRRTI